MPELPEVEVLVLQLRKKLAGHSLSRARLISEGVYQVAKKEFEENCQNQKIKNVERLGKFLALVFENGAKCWFHLGMTGQLVWSRPGVPLDSHVHAVLQFQDLREELRFRDIRKFGEIFLTHPGAKTPENLRHLAPDPFQMTECYFADQFRRRTGKIKSLLLNQGIVAGLGNIYANESLYRARIDPRKRANRVRRVRLFRLFHEVRAVLNQAIECGGSSIDDFQHTDGSRGNFQKRHQVYGRDGKPCYQCGSLIRKVVLSGRSSFFCSECQT